MSGGMFGFALFEAAASLARSSRGLHRALHKNTLISESMTFVSNIDTKIC